MSISHRVTGLSVAALLAFGALVGLPDQASATATAPQATTRTDTT
jgi:hypothetical protein